MAKERALSTVAKSVYDALKGSETPLTLAELKGLVPEANSAHLVALRNRGLVASEQTVVETLKVVKSKVNLYTVAPTDEPDADAETDETAE